MHFYGLALMPLIRKLREPHKCVQSVYADDAACCGSLQDLKSWTDNLISFGKYYGYFPEPSKSRILVKDEFIEKAERIFEGYGLKFVSGSRYLGVFFWIR